MNSKVCKLGTRGSPLAMAQSKMTRDALAKRWPEWSFELVEIKTTGDLDQKTPLHAMGGMGVFVKELELALLDGSIDLAIHSLKDVPHTMPDGLEMTACFYREDPRDAWISNGVRFADLPQGAKVGTGSPRRIAQLKELRPDLEFVTLRGNLDTRIAKATSGELDGILLAAAGLNRLGRTEHVVEYFEPTVVLPAIAQGIVALEGRVGCPKAALALGIQAESARLAADLERGLMVRLGGGCKVPMAALASPNSDETWTLSVYVANPDLTQSIRLDELSPQNADASALMLWMEGVAQKVEAALQAKGMPLPKELPEHYLLRDSEA